MTLPGHKPKWNLDMSPDEWYQKEDPWGVSRKKDELDKAAHVLEIIPECKYGIDLGCGEGTFTVFYDGKIEYLSACDVSPTAIERAKNKSSNIDFFVQDITERFDLKKKFDVVLINEVLYYIHPSKWKNMSENVYRLLNQNGMLIVTCGQYFEITDIEKMFPKIHFHDFYKNGSWFTMLGELK